MSPERDSHETDDTEREPFDEGQRRTMFSTTWFRAVIVLVVLGVVAAVAVPYVLEMINPPGPEPRPPVAAKAPAPPVPAPVVVVPPPPTEKKEPANPVLTPAAPSATPAKGEARKRAAAQKEAQARAPAKPATSGASGGDAGAYWVQVGAFKDSATAKRVAARLRDAQFRVEESVKRIGESAPAAASTAMAGPTAGPDRYDVLVSGGSLADLNARLTAKGLAAEPSGSGVTIRPSLPLRDAVALSKDLAADGLKVQVKRAVGAGASTAARTAPASGGGQTLHRVRVGAFPDRASAQSAARDLEARGYTPFIARGRD